MKTKVLSGIVGLILLIGVSLGVINQEELVSLFQDNVNNEQEKTYNLSEIPVYNGEDYVVINDNKPEFTEEDITTTSFEKYSDLDNLGRCGVAYANISKETMPTEERGSIGMIKPSGWHTVKYDIVNQLTMIKNGSSRILSLWKNA